MKRKPYVPSPREQSAVCERDLALDCLRDIASGKNWSRTRARRYAVATVAFIDALREEKAKRLK
ncbi:MAG: hypothetical protein RIQ93_2488 [Verrucomicrobiota bacterium]